MKALLIKFWGWCIEILFEERGTPEEEYKKLKLRLDEIQSNKNKMLLFMKTIICSLITTLLIFLFFHFYNFYTIPLSIGFGFICGVIAGIMFFFVGTIMEVSKEREIKRELLKYETDIIKEQVQEDIFENSIKMSYKYLDQYYLQTREQAKKGFVVTVCVSVFGAMLIGVGILMMFLGKTEPSYVTCASGVITEFIAAVFFYLYNRTIISMSKYHNKLVLSHNISTALKVADSLPDDDKVKTKDLIISELLKDINSYLIKNDSEDCKK